MTTRMMSLISATSTSATMNDTLTLRAVREGRMGKTVILLFSGEAGDTERLTLSRGEYESLGSPAVGTIPDPVTLAHARRMAANRAALATALHILECGDTTHARMHEKLAARGYDTEAIAHATAAIDKHGYIDESRLAARGVTLCVKKGWGRRRIFAYLTISRGIPAEEVSRAITAAEESGEADFAAMRRAFIEERRERGMEKETTPRALKSASF